MTMIIREYLYLNIFLTAMLIAFSGFGIAC